MKLKTIKNNNIQIKDLNQLEVWDIYGELQDNLDNKIININDIKEIEKIFKFNMVELELTQGFLLNPHNKSPYNNAANVESSFISFSHYILFCASRNSNPKDLKNYMEHDVLDNIKNEQYKKMYEDFLNLNGVDHVLTELERQNFKHKINSEDSSNHQVKIRKRKM